MSFFKGASAGTSVQFVATLLYAKHDSQVSPLLLSHFRRRKGGGGRAAAHKFPPLLSEGTISGREKKKEKKNPPPPPPPDLNFGASLPLSPEEVYGSNMSFVSSSPPTSPLLLLKFKLKVSLHLFFLCVWRRRRRRSKEKGPILRSGDSEKEALNIRFANPCNIDLEWVHEFPRTLSNSVPHFREEARDDLKHFFFTFLCFRERRTETDPDSKSEGIFNSFS